MRASWPVVSFTRNSASHWVRAASASTKLPSTASGGVSGSRSAATGSGRYSISSAPARDGLETSARNSASCGVAGRLTKRSPTRARTRRCSPCPSLRRTRPPVERGRAGGAMRRAARSAWSHEPGDRGWRRRGTDPQPAMPVGDPPDALAVKRASGQSRSPFAVADGEREETKFATAANGLGLAARCSAPRSGSSSCAAVETGATETMPPAPNSRAAA